MNNEYNTFIALLKQLQDIRQELISLSGGTQLAKLSDFLDEADFDVAKAIRNVKQAIKLAGKKR